MSTEISFMPVLQQDNYNQYTLHYIIRYLLEKVLEIIQMPKKKMDKQNV